MGWYAERDQQGNVVGLFRQLQPGRAEELLDDNHPDVVERAAARARIVREQEINAERDAALLAGVDWGGKRWHSDTTFQLHLTGLIAAFEAGILPANAAVPVRTRDNTIEQLDGTQLKQLAGAVLLKVQQVWAASWAAKDALG